MQAGVEPGRPRQPISAGGQRQFGLGLRAQNPHRAQAAMGRAVSQAALAQAGIEVVAVDQGAADQGLGRRAKDFFGLRRDPRARAGFARLVAQHDLAILGQIEGRAGRSLDRQRPTPDEIGQDRRLSRPDPLRRLEGQGDGSHPRQYRDARDLMRLDQRIGGVELQNYAARIRRLGLEGFARCRGLDPATLPREGICRQDDTARRYAVMPRRPVDRGA